MACGCPVLCSASGSLAEITGEAVLRLDPMDSTSMAKALEKAASDPKTLETLRKMGFLQCQKFTWKRTADSVFDLYLGLAGIQ